MKISTIIILAVSAVAVWLFVKWQGEVNQRRGLQWSFLGS